MTTRSLEADGEGSRAVWLDRRTPPHVLTLVAIASLPALNMNIVLPSLPGLSVYYEADYAVVALAVSAYLGLTALLQLGIGPLSDRYGRRPVLLGGFAIFLAATAACLVAPTIEIFLACRFLQAFVIGGIVLSRAIVRDMVPMERAASMIGYVTMGMSVAPMIGPMFGGVLDEAFGWRAVFAFTFLFGIVVTALAWADLGETNRAKSGNFRAQFAAYPELATSRRFWGYSCTAAFTSGAFFALLGGGPWVATEILGMSPSALGLYFGLIALGYMFGNFLSGRYAVRMGIDTMMVFGGAITVFGVALAMTFFAVGIVHPLAFFGSILFVGLGNGLVLPSANAGMVSVRPNLAGSASGLGGALTIGAGAMLSAASGAVLTPETGPWLMLALMLASAVGGSCASLWVLRLERRRKAARG